MNKITIPAILFVVALGIFFTYTKDQYAKVSDLRSVNSSYENAIKNANELIAKRDQVVNAYNSISENDRKRLEEILPDRVDIIRLIIDIRSLIERRGGKFKDADIGAQEIKVGEQKDAKVNSGASIVAAGDVAAPIEDPENANGVKPTMLTIKFSATYDNFLSILKDIESSLRLVEISKIEFTPGDTNQYDYTVELKTFWLKQ